MPTYVYRREDGSTFEIQQRITEDPLEVCPETGQAVKRVISANTGLIFKGSGFYLTDYARSNGNKSGATTTGENGQSAKDAASSAEDKAPSDKGAAKTATSDAE